MHGHLNKSHNAPSVSETRTS